ncbi:MAG: hypothetical protein D6822_00425 [Cyanobacteria bacterium J149]|nr:MAG: hypothetical protein D6822_00425 [Cyanobacteria bacterium J149]
MLEDRLRKAIKFFREFKDKSDSEFYRKSVLLFCDLVEEYLARETEEFAEKLFTKPTPREHVQE